jgi:MarR family transcriptional regulator, organic hydroperoxide resistance regulator
MVALIKIFVKLISNRYNIFMNSELLHEYIERISCLLGSEARMIGADMNLQPVQLNALNFINRANRYSNTLQAVTEYLGLTKGTVSQTLAILESNGLIKKSPDKKDGRIVRLNVTPSGNKLLKKTIPSPSMRKTWDALDEQDQNALVEGLKQFLSEMQKINGMQAFGICGTCRFNSKKGEKKFFCDLTQENLSLKDTELLCREHQSI